MNKWFSWLNVLYTFFRLDGYQKSFFKEPFLINLKVSDDHFLYLLIQRNKIFQDEASLKIVWKIWIYKVNTNFLSRSLYVLKVFLDNYCLIFDIIHFLNLKLIINSWIDPKFETDNLLFFEYLIFYFLKIYRPKIGSSHYF